MCVCVLHDFHIDYGHLHTPQHSISKGRHTLQLSSYIKAEHNIVGSNKEH